MTALREIITMENYPILFDVKKGYVIRLFGGAVTKLKNMNAEERIWIY